jgi:beta-N-acetylhexosaminidase
MSLNLRQKIAQMLCFGFNGAQWSDCQELKTWLDSQDGLGWLIEFDYDCHQKAYGKNILSLEQLEILNQNIKDYYQKKHPTQLPLMLSIDVEGGRVDRLSKLKTYEQLPRAEEYKKMTIQQRHLIWQRSAVLLKKLGFDLNFAPVVDLNLSPSEGIFGPLGRCFSDSPEEVIQMAEEYLDVLKEYGLMGCLKHFPGHGSAQGDSHEGFVDVTSTFSYQEMIPYESLLQKPGLVECIMTAHVINRELDSSGLPATLSKTVLTDILRKRLNYQGLIISDDLQMYAIAKNYSKEDALVYTIEAGADIVMFCNQLGWDTPAEIINIIEQMVKIGRIQENHIDAAYERIAFHKQLRMDANDENTTD